MDSNTINRGISTSWDRLFYSVEVEDSQIVVKTRVLNVFQRMLRTIFGAYSNTIWNQKKIDHLAWQYPDAVEKINDFVAMLVTCNKSLTQVHKPKSFPALPNEIKLAILEKIDGPSLGRCQNVSKSFQQFIGDTPDLWKNNFAYEHNGYTPPIEPSIGWRAFYIQQANVAATIAAGRLPEPIRLEIPGHIQGGFIRGNELFSVGLYNNSELYCHDLTTGKQISMFNEIPGSAFAEARDKPQPRQQTQSTLHPLNTTHFLSVGLRQASIWDASKYACVFAIDNVKNGLVHAEGSRIFYYTDKNCLEVWDFTTKTLLTKIEDLSIKDISSKDQYQIIDNVFFALTNDGTIHAYDIVEGKKLYTLASGNDRPFTKLLATPKHLVAINERPSEGLIPAPIAEENQAYVFTPATGSMRVIQLAGAGNPFQEALPVQITQNQLIGIPRNTERTVACWDLDTCEITKRFEPPNGSIYSFAVGEPDRLVITTTRQGIYNIGISIWDLNNENMLNLGVYKGCSNYFRDGTTVKIHNHIMYFGRWPNDAFHFWDLSTAKPLGTFPFESSYSHNDTWYFDGSRFFVDGHAYNLNQVPQKSLASRASQAIKSIFGK